MAPRLAIRVRRSLSNPVVPVHAYYIESMARFQVVTVRTLDDPMLGQVWGDRLTRLDFDVTAAGPAGTFTLTVKDIP